MTDTAIAEVMAVNPSTISRWRQRHKAELAAAAAKLHEAIIDLTITEKVHRLQAKQERWLGLRQVVAERGADPSMANVPGGKTGLMVRQYKMLGSGDYAQVVEEYKVDTGLLSAASELEAEAADELGQKPRPDVNIDNRTQILIRNYAGIDPEAIV